MMQRSYKYSLYIPTKRNAHAIYVVLSSSASISYGCIPAYPVIIVWLNFYINILLSQPKIFLNYVSADV